MNLKNNFIKEFKDFEDLNLKLMEGSLFLNVV